MLLTGELPLLALSYYEMLNKLLTYNYKKRPTAADLLKDEFALFHQAKGKNMSRTKSVLLEGTGEKAATAFGFIQFQRSRESPFLSHEGSSSTPFHAPFNGISLICSVSRHILSYHSFGDHVGQRRPSVSSVVHRVKGIGRCWFE